MSEETIVMANMNVHPECTTTPSSERRVKAAVLLDWLVPQRIANPKCVPIHNTYWQPTVAKP